MYDWKNIILTCSEFEINDFIIKMLIWHKVCTKKTIWYKARAKFLLISLSKKSWTTLSKNNDLAQGLFYSVPELPSLSFSHISY